MPLKLMIDSGAFSVWKSGKTIDLNDYIRFCKSHPNISVIVSLDVIPPKNTILSEETKNEICQEGWKNYLKMIRTLPMDKVMPVYHRGENIRWLEKYIDFGCPFIGIAPRFDGSSHSRFHKFITDCKEVLLDSEGKPVIRAHGLAVTNHKMMNMLPWYSVDSATWAQLASWGKILVPKLTKGQWNFRTQWHDVFCGVRVQKRQNPQWHILAMKEQSPQMMQVVEKWLKEHGIGLGTHDIFPANGKKPQKLIEMWADRAKTQILRIKEPGVCNNDQVRRWINAVFYHKCNDVLPIRQLYLAGNEAVDQVEDQIRYRLLSFANDKRQIEKLHPKIGQCEEIHEFSLEQELERRVYA